MRLPKFEMRSRLRLNDVLTALGMSNAFDRSAADFSGMNGRRDLFLSDVIHEAVVKVNEEGTEAAAATGAVMQLMSAGPPPVTFNADHPFIFFIRHNQSGSILFLGRLSNPS